MEELNEKEKQILSELIDPDEQVEVAYKWDEEFQRYILSALCHDKNFLVQALPLVKSSYFADEVHKLICRILFEYFEKYKMMPTKLFVVQEVKEAIESKKNEQKLYYLSELNSVYSHYVPGVEDRDYLLEKLLNFAKRQALNTAFNECLAKIKESPDSDKTWMDINRILRDALLVDRKFDPGMDYFQTFEERYNTKQEQLAKEVFTTAFEAIDRQLLGGGPSRGEVYSWMGLSGTGKSLCCVAATIRNIVKLGRRVLYISLEMDEDKIAERFDAQFANVDIGELEEHRDVIEKALNEQVKDQEDPRLLVIKQFPAGTMDVATLRAYMQQLALHGFKPDLVIIDYIGEMKDYPNMPTWESRYRIVRDLRGLATEENICIITAMQPNKSAREAQKTTDRFGHLQSGVIDDDSLADSFGQIRPLDGCWSINQTGEEKKADVARIFVIKHRHGKSRYTFWVEYNMKTLAITEITEKVYSERLKKVQNEAQVRLADMPSRGPDGKEGLDARQKVEGNARRNYAKNDVGYEPD